MPKNTDELVGLLDLEEIEQGLYRGEQPQTLLQQTFGGQVLAQSLVAAHRTVGEDRLIHSLHAYFLRPGSKEHSMIYDVQTLRDGRGFSSRHTLARQEGTTKFAMNSSFHVNEPGLEHSDAMPPDLPAPEDCPTMAEMFGQNTGMGRLMHEWDALDVRFAGDSGRSKAIEARSHGAHMRVWVKTSSKLPEDQVLHRAVLAYLSDLTLLSVSMVPHDEIDFLSAQMQVASIDHAMWFHRDVRADEWMLYDQVSPSASNSLGFSSGRIMQDGKLVATCSQEGLIRIVD